MKTILFVDDHKSLARLSCEILKMHGYRTESAYSAEAALVRFEQDKFDLVVTDYRMEGMDGLQLAERLREQAPGLPIIIVSGYTAPERCDTISAWVEKQEMFPGLLDTIRRLLQDTEAEAQTA
jgi:CheY-like chemotaxis protein